MMHQHPVGFPTGLVGSSIDGLFQNLAVLQEKLTAQDPDNLKNVFYTVAVHSGVGGAKPERTKASFAYQTILPFDLDHVDQTRPYDYLNVVAKILGAGPQSLALISTGNGLHILAHLKVPIRSSKYLEETKPHYNELVYKINRELAFQGLKGNADPSVYEPARILRLPNSINEKGGESRECRLIQYPGLVPLDIDVIKLSGLTEAASQHIGQAELRKNYPKPDFPYVMSHCEFLKWSMEHPEEVHEPQFMSLVGLLGAMPESETMLWDNKPLTARDVGQYVFNGAANSKSLERQDFDHKWEHGTRYGAPKCSTVSNNWLGGCEKCPYHHKIVTPLALKSKEHIASAENGYWRLGKNGTPLHPEYADLCRIYRQTHEYATCAPKRIFTFHETHYKKTDELNLKAWLEKNTGHEDALREVHRTEFVNKLLATGALSYEQELELFDETIRGKLNCRNGILDVASGVLSPHTGKVGFRYVLPYDYIPGVGSEFFIDWLSEMMQNRTELMDAVLDLMAYCLWPHYDSHVFGFFVGEGRNGKSTVLQIMQALLGRDNYAAISMSRLGGNRFAAANLEGKLANISEESSGSDLTIDESNVLKALSSGAELEVEQKGEKAFVLRNRAKLIFSANKTPRFHEAGKAIRDRLIVIPFDHTIENSDANIGRRLVSEVPQICSMLVDRIQKNILANDGKFIVSKGGKPAHIAQDKVLLGGNSIAEWAQECLESSIDVPADCIISCYEAFHRYLSWCDLNRYNALSKHLFGYHMSHGILSPLAVSKTIRIGGKVIRGYPHTRWKEVIE